MSKNKDKVNRTIFGFALAWIAVSYSILFLLDIDAVRRLSREDGVVESIGAVCFLISSILFFGLYRHSRKGASQPHVPLKGNVFYLLLGMAFLFACLEEISWGQRIVGFATPENLREANLQKEFNLHNLRMFHGKTETGERKSFLALLLNMDRMFSMFWISYCVLLPVAYRLSVPIRKFLDNILMPIVPMFLGFMFVVNYASTKVLEASLNVAFYRSIVEIKESNFAVLFLLIAVSFRRSGRVPGKSTGAT